MSLRMTTLYYTLFPFLLDWSNSGGKTALHVAAQAGNTAFISLLCDWGADLDLTDLQGNTPLHYASAWGHVETIRVLLERGCQFATRNYEGFTASDFAYSTTVMNALQAIARELFEERRSRRKVEAAEARSQGGSAGLNGRFRSGSVSTDLSTGSGSAVSSNVVPQGYHGGYDGLPNQSLAPAPGSSTASRPTTTRSPSVPVAPTLSIYTSTSGTPPLADGGSASGLPMRRSNSAHMGGGSRGDLTPFHEEELRRRQREGRI